ncbi:MAG: triose-phosphate isomerase [Elusimicrobiota bacterium]
MRKPLLAGNWKMYKVSGEAVSLVEGLRKNLADVTEREVLVCPPFTALSAVQKVLSGSTIKLGAQNMSWESEGAFTGEISPAMLKDSGCSYVIIGHSERRQYFQETDETVNRKIKSALKFGLTPIVCVGETLEEREKNITFKILERQIREGLAGLSSEESNKIVVAYEPIWAIGTGRTAAPAQAEDVHAFIRKLLKEIAGDDAAMSIRILYGGSVKPDNISELMACENIDGGLIGGASLNVESFTKIVKYADKRSPVK